MVTDRQRESTDIPVVTLYGRSGCHLCDDARTLLARLAPTLRFRVVEVDIDEHADLLARYDTVVPVIEIGGREVARAPLRDAAVRRALEAALQRRSNR